MRIKKIKTHPLEKCYCVAPLSYLGKECLVVAAEKVDRCLLFDTEGTLLETIWDGPGGTMSIVQVPGTDGHFLATQRFYSPNDGADAVIVYVRPRGKNDWEARQIATLPFLHRFDIMERGGKHYLLACTLKSGHRQKDDWSSPGKIYAAELPANLADADELQSLTFTVLAEGLLKNHGFFRGRDGQGDFALVGSENGIIRVTPPSNVSREWICDRVFDDPASDMVLVDLDGDGREELVVISPFHGDIVTIYRQENAGYRQVYQYPARAEFAHAMWAGDVDGRPVAIVGHRNGKQALLAFTFRDGDYVAEVLEENAGSANLLHYKRGGKDCILSANREHNEIAFYEIEASR